MHLLGMLTMKTILVCVWLVSSLIHMISGCSLYAPSEITEVTGYTRGSVVLPCYCTEGEPTPTTASWHSFPLKKDLWKFPGEVMDSYKDRMIIPVTPGNLSLHLSDLTLSDAGDYRCYANEQYTDIRLKVKGCVLTESEPKSITRFTGDSVVLPCACTDAQKKPEWFTWTALLTGGQSSVIIPPNVNDPYNDRYKDRVKVLDSVFPGNLSLHLSDLTLLDGGYYRCEADGSQRDVFLTVKGCVLSDSEPIHITGFTGDSVILPCACTDVQRKPGKFKWTNHKGAQIYPSSVNERNKHSVQLLKTSLGNLSLRISDLTLSDGGSYKCDADGNQRDITLTVKGCVLPDSEPIHITGFTGASVILPCACTDVQRKPKFVEWTAESSGNKIFIIVKQIQAKVGPYKDRVQVFDSVSPGNLSIRLSDLTLSDGGKYRCEADGKSRDITLTVKGCVLSDSGPKRITGFTGDSVVLPCACMQRKPEQVKWTAHPGGQSTVIFSQSPANVNDRYKHRVRVLDSVSPRNLSIRLSDVTVSDTGSYRCEADGNYRDITLTVKGVTTQSPAITKTTRGSEEISKDKKNSILYATIAAVVAAVAVFGAVLIYCRVRSRKNAHAESREEQEMSSREQEENNADSVTYSTVVHSKTVKNAKIQNQNEDSTVYAGIKL